MRRYDIDDFLVMIVCDVTVITCSHSILEAGKDLIKKNVKKALAAHDLSVHIVLISSLSLRKLCFGFCILKPNQPKCF